MLGDPNVIRVNVPFVDHMEMQHKDDTVVTINNHIVDAQYIDFMMAICTNAQVRISKQFKIIVGDIVRVYRMTDYENNWFKDCNQLEKTFASSVNDHFAKRHLGAKYPEYKEFIQGDNLYYH